MVDKFTIELTSHVLADAFRDVLADGVNFHEAVRVLNDWLHPLGMNVSPLGTGYWAVFDEAQTKKIFASFAQAFAYALDTARRAIEEDES